ncbi:MAG: hypothetical protein FIB08_17820, partial [Candidatus Methanoperedens sp.]|nr:hypothetical protein [Candidatus Methanoperedens sp.]
MDRIKNIIKKHDKNNKCKFIFLFILLFFFTVAPSNAISFSRLHDNTSGNLTDPECRSCHLNKQIQYAQPVLTGEDKKLLENKAPIININSVSTTGNNYTAVISIGQTPNQLGIFFRGDPDIGGYTGWTWWDSIFGDKKQKNLIQLMVFDNSSGTIRPITELASIPYWPQASYRNHSGGFSFKADIGSSPIITQQNYADKMDIWMIKKINLTGVSNANLTFWTWYSMETDWDYGYVAVYSGNRWTNLQGTLTTNSNPNSNNLGNGITGNSGEWIQETMNLTPFAGNNVYLGFRFKSDDATNAEGLYIDDIQVTSDTTNLFIDDAETPIQTKSLNVTVSYPNLTLINVTNPLTSATILQYSRETKLVELVQDFQHPGTYYGYFIYAPPPVDYEWYGDYYPGNYTISLNTIVDSSTVTATTQFQTTVLGCNGCHNKDSLDNTETSFIHGGGTGSPSCTLVCHSGSIGYWAKPFPAVNPMHVHEMQYGHYGGFLQGNNHLPTPYNVSAHVTNAMCIQCHTAFLHDNTGTDTFEIASYTLYGTNISYSSRTHSGLTCEECHGTLEYPEIPQNQNQLQGTFGDYNPTFTSHESFTDTYIMTVNGSENLSIKITGDNTSKYIFMYAVGPVDNTSTEIQYTCGSIICYVENSLSNPIYYNITNPYIGTWVVKLTGLQEGELNYTISSNYPIQYKPIIRIPECNDCHNSTATGGSFTEYEIPDWNPGFAHADTDKDGTLDVQCRLCHNAMHEITIKDCQDCHTAAPIGHPIQEPTFSQYTPARCLACHGDPHEVSSAGGTDCIACHAPND